MLYSVYVWLTCSIFAILSWQLNFFDVSGNGFWWRYVVIRSTSLHEGLKASIFDNAEGMHAFRNPLNNLHTIENNEKNNKVLWGTYRDSVLVCWQCEYVILVLLIHSKTAVIDLSLGFAFDIASCAAWMSFVWLAASTASSPQQILVCHCKLLVDFASEVSK